MSRYYYTSVPARQRSASAGAPHDAPHDSAGANEHADEDEAFDDPQIDAIHARIEERMLRCLRTIVMRIGRNHERCGKAACLRARRCRGVACEPAMAKGEDDDE